MNSLDIYQANARLTAIYPVEQAVIYPVIGLVAEAGEVAGKIQKPIRKGGDFDREAIAKELGDVLWYVANAAADIDFKLSDIAQLNLDKLKSRHERGLLNGDGDNR